MKKTHETGTNKIAPGMNDHEELDKEASKEEVSKGDFTKVVTMSFDEVDPS